jgi:proteasome accessory factor B
VVRLERLVNLLAALLQADRPLSRSDIHERVPGYPDDVVAYRRAFERDKETLRNMGVPVVTEALDLGHDEVGEGYRVPRDLYQLRDPGLTREEMDALAVAASAVKLSSDAAANALWKLGGGRGRHHVVHDVDLADDERLGMLFAARRELRAATFVYKGTERTVQPHRLTFRNGHWYVNGYDVAHEDVRTYRIDRIDGAITTSDPGSFTTPPRSEQHWLPPWRMGEEEPVEVHVRIDADYGAFALDQVAGERVTQHADGTVDVWFTVTNRDALRSFVLGFLEHAEIVSPPEVRDAMIAHLRALAGAG